MTTRKELDNRLERLNSYTKNNYGFNIAYGGYMLVKEYKRGGEMDISRRLSKTQMLNFLDDMLSLLEVENL